MALLLTVPGTCVQAQELEITNSVLLSWPAPTEEAIVVGADSPATNAVWTPWPEPIFNRFGKLCMTVPVNTTKNAQYFKLVPGTQFIDDFSEPAEPLATRDPWVPYFYGAYGNLFRFAVTNGVYRIEATGSSDGRVPIMPPGPDIIVRDFTASVDLLEWSTSGATSLGIGARVWRDPNGFPGNSTGYIGILVLNDIGHIGQARLNIFDGATTHLGSYFTIDPGADYRLEFSAVGRSLYVKLFNLTDPSVPVRQFPLTSSNYSRGFVALWIQSPGPNAIVLDNFFLTGTRP